MSLVFTMLLFTCSFSAFAQLPGFGDDVDDETPAAPIDSLIFAGFAAGAIYGVKKYKQD
ncbi:PID-CTERM protein-sorting domain-containing protein [Mesonia phycicola]|nr:hypothetical protein [Mesonia phycicola]